MGSVLRAGELWVSGTCDGMVDWLHKHDVALVVNCLARPNSWPPSSPWVDEHVNMDQSSGLLQRASRALESTSLAVGSGKKVLVHCAAGVHRSGSFAVLAVAI